MLIGLFSFMLGSMVGSFLNVCIYRLPREESIVIPPSHCVKCSKKIPWYDNIPLVSYVMLGARCRFCKERISFRYFVVELLTALLFLGFYLALGQTAKYVVYAAVGAALVLITFIDLEHQIIPDEVTVPGILAGLLASGIFPALHHAPSWFWSLWRSLLGAAAGAGTLFAIGVVGKLIFKRDAMGGGDVKLMAMLGAFLGWQMVLLTIFLSSVFGSFVGIFLKIKYKVEEIPYGPYLALGAVVSMVWGYRIVGMFCKN